MRLLPWALLAVLLALGVWGWQRDRALQARAARLQHTADSLALVAAQAAQDAEAARRDMAAADSAADQVVGQATADATASRQAAQTARQRLATALAGNAAALAQLDTLVAAHEAERDAWRRERGALLQKLQVRDTVISRQAAAYLALNQQLQAQLALTDHWRNEAQPPLWQGLATGWRATALRAGTVAAGALLGDASGAVVGVVVGDVAAAALGL